MVTTLPASSARDLESLARLRFVLQQDLRRLGLRSDAAAAGLRELVPVGGVREGGGYLVRVVGGRPILDVVDPSLVDREFLAWRPDVPTLLERFLATGEVPAGCRLRDRRPSVYVTRSTVPPLRPH